MAFVVKLFKQMVKQMAKQMVVTPLKKTWLLHF